MEQDSPNRFLEPTARLLLGLEYPRHFTEWGELTGKHKRLQIIASRDHGKTTFFDTILPITRILQHKAYKILLVGYSDTQILKVSGAIKSLFDARPRLKEFSPKSPDDWSKSRMVFKDGSLIETLAFGSAGRGGHYDLIVIGDPVKDFGGMNADDQSQFFTRTITPMCNPGGQIIFEGTPVYEGDLIDRIEKNKAFETFRYPAINDKGETLWPERWSLENLEARKRELEASDDPFAFETEYLLNKVDGKAQFFKQAMFKFYKLKPDGSPDIPELLSRAASWDPALSLNGDFNAMMVTGTDEEKKTYIMPEYAEFKSDDVQAIVDEFFRLTELYDVPYWIIETVGFQKIFKEHIYAGMREKNRHFGIKEIRTHKKSKAARIMALQPRIVAGSLLFHPTEHADLIKQFKAFPRGAHDDMIDALASMLPDWDKPQSPTKPTPPGSWQWWQTQTQEDSEDWYSTLSTGK